MREILNFFLLMKDNKKIAYIFLSFFVLIISLALVIFFSLNLPSKQNDSMSINKRSDENLLDLKRDEHKKSVIKKEKGKVLQQTNSFFVDVKGSVSYPQVVEVKEGDIVQKAINLAGGTNSVADLNQLNLAEKLIPNQVVYVPFKSEKIPEQFLTKAKNIENEDTSDNSSGSKKVIDINESNSSDLQQINGIGSKKADEIIKFRNENGHFKSIDDLKKISGFGDKTVEKLKEYLKVG